MSRLEDVELVSLSKEELINTSSSFENLARQILMMLLRSRASQLPGDIVFNGLQSNITSLGSTSVQSVSIASFASAAPEAGDDRDASESTGCPTADVALKFIVGGKFEVIK